MFDEGNVFFWLSEFSCFACPFLVSRGIIERLRVCSGVIEELTNQEA